jgi:LuxR family maltose regulon positive regulatory protein
MTGHILATKLYLPPPRPGIVLRPQLVERLNKGLLAGRKLTVVLAPAGFGKTTLLSEWLSAYSLPERNKSGVRAAWLSLEKADREPVRFLAYLIAALQTLFPKVGESILADLQSPQPSPTETLLTNLLNEIALLPGKFILVLDDYHVIEAKAVDEALAFLVEHLPAQLHLVIASREDPPLPLARLRGRGQLTELRAADLRFTPSETADFLNHVMDLNVSDDDIVALEARTEGWIAGLQLAALSMQGRSDLASFIRAFTGSHRFVLDYLAEEVLQRQPERVRNFLLQTSILDRLNGLLCDAVTGLGDGKAMLDILEHSNLFIIPLDDQRQWYRYHHLFADVLQTHLMEAQPDQVPVLNRRASLWYEQHGFPAESIHHALAAEDFERAADLIELAWSAMDINMQSAVWLGWAKALPETLICARPVLSHEIAWALLDGGDMEACEIRLREAERWLGEAADRPASELQMVVADKELFRSLPASIATARAYRALALGDIPGAVMSSRQALMLTPKDDSVRFTQATALLGLAQYASGDLEGAARSLSDFQENLRKAGDISTAISITFTLAEIKTTCGHLREAVNIYQQALQLASSRGEPMPTGTADLYRGLSELYLEQGDLEAAVNHLLLGKKLGEQAMLTAWPQRLYSTEARIKKALGDLDGALVLLREAERLYIRGPIPETHPIPALRVQIWIAQGRLSKAQEWVRKQGLSVGDDLNSLREFEYISLARVLVALYQGHRIDNAISEAIQLLARLEQAAEVGGRMGSLIEILVVQAVAYQAQGDAPRALASLERALLLAEPEGYFRVFIEEGDPVRLLILRLRSAIDKLPGGHSGSLWAYMDKLLAAFVLPGDTLLQNPIQNLKTKMAEPLSERELEVLKLLATELSGPEIARHLIVSLNTLRTHTKNIFNKLDVNNRRAAIRRAEELNLL